MISKYGTQIQITKIATSIKDVLGEKLSTKVFDENNDDFIYFVARSITADVPNSNGDLFPKEELKKSYETFIGKGLYLNHDANDVNKSVGKIIDAWWIEKDGDCHVLCLCKVDKKAYPLIARKIQSGIIDSVSMGCSCLESECSICGKKMSSENDFCEHMKLLGKEIVADGVKKKVMSINRGITFGELSLVANPADEKAKLLAIYAQAKLEQKEEIKKIASEMEIDIEASEYTDFVKKYLEEHENTSIADAAKAWKEQNSGDKKEEKKENMTDEIKKEKKDEEIVENKKDVKEEIKEVKEDIKEVKEEVKEIENEVKEISKEVKEEDKKEEDKKEEDKKDVKEEVEKESGKILGPGIPDGTGPYRVMNECPLNKNESKEEKINEEPITLPETIKEIKEDVKELDSAVKKEDIEEVKEITKDLKDDTKTLEKQVKEEVINETNNEMEKESADPIPPKPQDTSLSPGMKWVYDRNSKSWKQVPQAEQTVPATASTEKASSSKDLVEKTSSVKIEIEFIKGIFVQKDLSNKEKAFKDKLTSIIQSMLPEVKKMLKEKEINRELEINANIQVDSDEQFNAFGSLGFEARIDLEFGKDYEKISNNTITSAIIKSTNDIVHIFEEESEHLKKRKDDPKFAILEDLYGRIYNAKFNSAYAYFKDAIKYYPELQKLKSDLKWLMDNYGNIGYAIQETKNVQKFYKLHDDFIKMFPQFKEASTSKLKENEKEKDLGTEKVTVKESKFKVILATQVRPRWIILDKKQKRIVAKFYLDKLPKLASEKEFGNILEDRLEKEGLEKVAKIMNCEIIEKSKENKKDVKEEIKEVKEDIKEVKEEVKEIENEVKEISKEVKEEDKKEEDKKEEDKKDVKEEVEKEVKELKEIHAKEIASVNEELNKIKGELEKTKKELIESKQAYTTLNTQIMIEAKTKKCEEIAIEAFKRGMISLDEKYIISEVKKKKNPINVRVEAAKIAIDNQIRDLMRMNDFQLEAYSETVKRFNKKASQFNSKLDKPFLANADLDNEGTLSQMLKNKWSKIK